MDIKNELKRTETFKNNVSTIKNQLDDVIVRGGGVRSETLAHMPNNIKAMLEQNYKKIAIINLYKNIDLRNGDDVEQTFQLNLSFKPSKIFVTIENICISNENQRSFYVPNGERGMHYSFQIINFDKNSITIKPKMIFVSGGTYFQDATLKQVIAIE